MQLITSRKNTIQAPKISVLKKYRGGTAITYTWSIRLRHRMVTEEENLFKLMGLVDEN